MSPLLRQLPPEATPEEPTGSNIEARLVALEDNVKRLGGVVLGSSNQFQEEKGRLYEEINKIHTQLSALQEVMARQTRLANQLEAQVNGVRSDSSAGIVASVVIFALLFLLSLFLR